MSSPSPPVSSSEPRPSPWLTWAASVAVPLLALAVQWGVQGANLANLERRQTATEAEVVRISTAQAGQAQQLARIETRLDGVERQLERLSLAVERFTQSRARLARDIP